MEIEKIKAQWEELDKIADRFKIKILKGSEVEILKDGSLRLSGRNLKRA